jgi:hypothetical protein
MTDLLRFKGDLTRADRDQMIGPDFGRRWLAIRKIDYNPDTNVSTVTLRGVMPEEYRQRLQPQVAQAQEHARIKELFVG